MGLINAILAVGGRPVNEAGRYDLTYYYLH